MVGISFLEGAVRITKRPWSELSPLFRDVISGTYELKLSTNYSASAQSASRDVTYFMADGIYPNWPIFVKQIHSPSGPAEQKFTERQESVRKDVERCFGVFQSRFGKKFIIITSSMSYEFRNAASCYKTLLFGFIRTVFYSLHMGQHGYGDFR